MPRNITWKHDWCEMLHVLNSFVQTISIAPLQVHYYSEVLLTQHGYCARISRQSATGNSQHGYCARISRRSATGNCKWRTCPRSLHGDESRSWTHDPSDDRRRLYQWAITPTLHFTLRKCIFSVFLYAEFVLDYLWWLFAILDINCSAVLF